jgi:6-phosphogluconolactonase/glucosamine-6-phosphate isomerase/deaminase
MKLIQVENAPGCQAPLFDRLLKEVQNPQTKRVLWLVSGGSNIALSVTIMDHLPDDLTPKLAIALTDERFGPVGFSDSNFQQLLDAGFQPKQATFLPVLVPDLDLEATRQRYEDAITTAFESADVIIAQFGIGTDGHIAGILPDTSSVSNTNFVVAYQTEQYTRLSLTLEALKGVTAAYVFAFGSDKQTALEKLSKDIPLDDEPSQILKQIPDSYVYNDQMGE